MQDEKCYPRDHISTFSVLKLYYRILICNLVQLSDNCNECSVEETSALWQMAAYDINMDYWAEISSLSNHSNLTDYIQNSIIM